MDRRRVIMAGFGPLAAVISTPKATAAPATAAGSYLFHDEFDGPASSAPDSSKWVVSNQRTPIHNPTGFDRPEFSGTTETVAKTSSWTANPISCCAPPEMRTATSVAW
jgi:hypothetical protein